jgi:mRNA-degrading endonuclease HigB of HigAB toxin-antitoxin module
MGEKCQHRRVYIREIIDHAEYDKHKWKGKS